MDNGVDMDNGVAVKLVDMLGIVKLWITVRV